MLTMVNEAYNGRLHSSNDELKFQMYCDLLRDADAKEVLHNFRCHVTTSPHPPSVADLLGNTKPKDITSRYVPGYIETAQKHIEMAEHSKFIAANREEIERASAEARAKARAIVKGWKS